LLSRQIVVIDGFACTASLAEASVGALHAYGINNAEKGTKFLGCFSSWVGWGGMKDVLHGLACFFIVDFNNIR